MHVFVAGVLPALAMHRPANLVPVPPIDPIGGLLGGGLRTALVGLVRTVADDFLRGVVTPLSRYLLQTPDLMREPTLRHEWLLAVGCLFAVAVLLVAVNGVALATGSSGRLAVAARHALGVRLGAGLLTAVLSLPVVALEVRLANLVVAALLPGSGGTGAVWGVLHRAVDGDAGAGLALLVTGVVGVVLLVLLVVLSLVRWASIWLLVVLSPVAMGFAALPGAADVSRIWWRLQVTAVFLPVGYAVLLGTYGAMFGSARTGLLGALSGVAVLALMTKLPAWAAGLAVSLEVRDVRAPVTGSVRRRRVFLRRLSGVGE